MAMSKKAAYGVGWTQGKKKIKTIQDLYYFSKVGFSRLHPDDRLHILTFQVKLA